MTFWNYVAKEISALANNYAFRARIFSSDLKPAKHKVGKYSIIQY